MPLQAPKIDDRRFEDLVKEARTLIPRYTPEWTDLNDNDPGIALVQLFAWLTDLMLYRLNQVPELNYIKFLQLLGIELRPAEPARAEVTFPLTDSQLEPFIIVPKGTQVAAAGAVGAEPVIFETDEALYALAAQLKKVAVFDGYAYSDATQQNDEAATPFAVFGQNASAGSALMLGFGYSDAVKKLAGFKNQFPKVQLNLAFFVHTEALDAKTTACGLVEAQVFPSAKLVWEYWNGKNWLLLSLDKDATLAFIRSGHVLVRTPAPGVMLPDKLLPAATEELFWIRVRVDKPGYERAPMLDAVRTNTIGVTQAQTVRDEVIGGSDGRPFQTFRLTFAPVLNGTLRLEVDEGQGFTPWTEIEDFFASGQKDNHFALNRTTGEVRFNDGQHGRIPVANVDNPDSNIVARIYRYGGGKKANVAAAQLKNLLAGPAGIKADGVTNLRPAVGGRDEETLEEAKLRAPQQLKNKGRAVTAEDFEELARAAGVKRAKALPLAHPGFPGVEVPGTITVIIVPDSDAPNPSPSEGLIRTVCGYLEPRRPLTAELYVVPPRYHEVKVVATIITQDSADLSDVKTRIEQRLLNYFHPLKGGEEGLGWEFGRDIFFSLAHHQVMNEPGVRRIEDLIVVVDGEETPTCQDIEIEPGALVFSRLHELEVIYETRE